MRFATVRALKNQTSALLRLAAKGEDLLITSHGKPIAILQGMREEDLEDYVLSRHPGIRKSLLDAEAEGLRKGSVSHREVIKRFEEKKSKERGKVRPGVVSASSKRSR